MSQSGHLLPRSSKPPRRCSDLVARWRAPAAAGALILTAALAVTPRAHACGPGQPVVVPPTAVPRSGATGVSTATSFVILSAAAPTGVSLAAGATALPIASVTPLGVGIDGTTGNATGFWLLKTQDFLPASTTLTLAMDGAGGGSTTLTTITTAAGYDKAPPTPAVIKTLALTRQRFPRSEIASGNCVFEEYDSFIALDGDPALIPNTAPESVISTITLAARYGGAAPQSFTFTGPGFFKGQAPSPDQPPLADPWRIYLDPSLEYCVTVTSFGDGDSARVPARSNMLCATVDQQSVRGAGDDGGALDAPGAGTSDAGTPATDGGTGAGGGAAGEAAGASSGCALAPAKAVSGSLVAAWSVAIAMAVAIGTARRRHRSSGISAG